MSHIEFHKKRKTEVLAAGPTLLTGRLCGQTDWASSEGCIKVKQSLWQGRTGPECSRRLRFPGVPENRNMKAVRLSSLRTGHLFPPPKYCWYSFLLEAESTRGYSAAGRVMSMKHYNHTIGDRTRELPACSAVPQSTVPPHAPSHRLT